MALPDIPKTELEKYPHILAGIQELEEKGFPVLVKDASLGGRFPVVNVTLMNPRTGGVFASFGAHPKFEVALERTLTELLQGRSFEGLNDVPAPSFNSYAVAEHNNLVDHFIDSTGVISWKFFSATPDYEFKHWDFSGSTEEEYNYLMSILEELGKEVYITDHEELGAASCRILVPDYSEIYQPEDLIWDNNNQALLFREDILNLHRLSNNELNDLVERLEESEIDNYMPIAELIGIAFDESSTWGQLVIGELKCLIYLALQRFHEAKEFVEMFLTFNDHTEGRRKFFQLLNIILDITIDEELALEDYLENLKRMYGTELLDTTIACVNGEIKFYGLTETNTQLEGLDKHQRLIESYQKIQKAKQAFQTI